MAASRRTAGAVDAVTPARVPGSAEPALRRALLALAGAGRVAGAVFLALVLESDHVRDRAVTAALELLVGWSFIGTGLLGAVRKGGSSETLPDARRDSCRGAPAAYRIVSDDT